MRGNARYRRRRGNEMDAAHLAVVREPRACARQARLAHAPLDADLRDTEQIPLLEEGGVEAFIEREVLPYAPDAWYRPDSIKTGYEISFTRYFYKPKPMRALEDIRADILAVEEETEGLLREIIGR